MAQESIDLRDTKRLTPYLEEFATENDRTCGIIAVSMLETLLEQLIRRRLVKNSASVLFEANGPLSTFSAKINIAAALGLITKSEQRELHTLRKIRNDFAHSLTRSSFQAPPIKAHVAQLQLRRSKITGKASKTRTEFEASVLVLMGFILGQLDKTRRIETPNDHVEQILHWADKKKKASTPVAKSGDY